MLRFATLGLLLHLIGFALLAADRPKILCPDPDGRGKVPFF